jgi:hypothetical protein
VLGRTVACMPVVDALGAVREVDRWTSTYIASYRCIQHLPTLPIPTRRTLLLRFPPRHHYTLPLEMRLQPHIRIHPRRNCHGGIAHWTVRCHTVVDMLVVLVAGVGGREVVLGAVRLGAVGAFEGEEVDEVAGGEGALLAD